jgi:Holliday junction resolvasome RuvABC endonuclease subunit
VVNVIGVDPGSVSAAYGILDGNGDIVDVGDVPVVNKMVDASGFLRVILEHRPGAAILEEAHSFPHQGTRSVFRFGQGYGLLMGVIACAGVSLHLVTPTRWKRHFGLDNDGEKSRALALRYWPGCQKLTFRKDHGRAEALLLARYLRETWR